MIISPKQGATARASLRKLLNLFLNKGRAPYAVALRLLAKYAFANRVLIIALSILTIFSAFFDVGGIAILAFAVSVITSDDPFQGLDRIGALGIYVKEFAQDYERERLFILLVLLAVGTQVLRALLSYMTRQLDAVLNFRVRTSLLEHATDHVNRLTFAEVTKHPVGTNVEKITQTGDLSGLVSIAHNAIIAIIFLIAYFALMLITSPLYTAVALIGIAFFALLVNFFIKKLEKLGHEAVSAVMTASKETIEYLNAPRLIRVFGITESATQSINQARRRFLSATLRAQQIRNSIRPIMEVMTYLGIGAFLIATVFFQRDSFTTTIPVLFLFFITLHRALPRIEALSGIAASVASNLPRIALVSEFLSPSKVRFSSKGGASIESFGDEITFCKVNFSYPDQQTKASNNLSFSISKGQTVGIVGPTGSGKSTITDLLLGLRDPDSGSITVDGRDLTSLDQAQWRRLIGMVEQDIFLLNDSIATNISLGNSSYSAKEIREACKLANADDFISALPNQYDTVIGDRGARLSGGERQRLALARALVKKPEILLLDEATSALDTESEQKLKGALRSLKSDHTVLIIAHRLSTVADADNLLVIDHGRLVEEGPPEKLVGQNQLFSRLWKAQSA